MIDSQSVKSGLPQSLTGIDGNKRVKPRLRAAAHHGDGDDENGLHDDAAQAYLAAASRIVSTCSYRSSAGDAN